MRYPSIVGFIVIVGLLPMVAVSTIAGAHEPRPTDWSTWKLGHLSRYIGSDDYETVFNDPFVRRAMKDLLGNNVSLFLRNIQVRGPIGFEGFGLVLDGNKPHEGDKESAVLIVDLYDGEIHAGIMSKGKITVYSKALRYAHLPIAIRQWVQWQVNHHLFMSEPKTDFHWVK